MTLSFEQIQAFLVREARLLDDREWDEWLACYHEDVTFWMPAWDDDDELTEDPQTEISLIYYPNRTGLEDRVYRLKTERSGASSLPEPRTKHFLSGLEILSRSEDAVSLRFNWLTKSYRYKKTQEYYGTSFYTLDLSGDRPLIRDKKIVLTNDCINQVVDVYHL
ncbi:benzoate 1,2-dioxygenase small subunit [Marinobacter sp. C2H3]|uniref:benzoate 1,2-dioxygenase small subunit n=1 Tax=Marinobacter sp. C2H3 TaxID=3119003 RepID=UPI00300EC1B0